MIPKEHLTPIWQTTRKKASEGEFDKEGDRKSDKTND
jgi:hypothetical protein